MGIGGDLMRIVAGDAHQAHIGVIGDAERIAAVEHRQARGSGVTATATVHAVGWAHILHHLKVAARFPFVERRVLRTVVAAAAHLARQLNARTSGDVVRIRRMISRRPMTTFALNAGEARVGALVGNADEAVGQTVADRMARQARTIRLPARGHKRGVCERPRVARVTHRIVGALMTFRARLRADVLRRKTRHAEKNVARQTGDDRHASGVRHRAERRPCFVLERSFSDDLIITRRRVPRDTNAVREFVRARDHRATRHAARLSDRQMLNALPITRGAPGEEARKREHKEKFPFVGQSVDTVHIARG